MDHVDPPQATAEVEFRGGPWDGHRQQVPAADLAGPREQLGCWMMLDGGWPPDTPDGCTPRAVYEPDPDPVTPAEVWLFGGYVYT